MSIDIEAAKTIAKTYYVTAINAVDWLAEEIIRKRNLRSILVLIGLLIFALFNPHQTPFQGLLHEYVSAFQWYKLIFWSLITLTLICAVIAAARLHTPTATYDTAIDKGSVIKGLLSFKYEDAGNFAHLQRHQELREIFQAITDNQWRFGVLTGDSGAGKTSFIQAGLWPELVKTNKAQCVYVKFSNEDPFKLLKDACCESLSLQNVDAEEQNILNILPTIQTQLPIILFFDQFEQFFVHCKRKKDREPFIQALAYWFTQAQLRPVKILISIRGDFFDRLIELQKAMKYSLSLSQYFCLERFDPDQATEIFCFMANVEGLEFDRQFLSEMVRQELADKEDGLVSPVDIQILAKMFQRQRIQNGKAFNRTTFQKLGGVEGLLDRYLTIVIETRETQSRRDAVLNVLLALTDLERNTRVGALSIDDIQKKLGNEVTDSDLKDVISWLQSSEVRLLSPSSEKGEEKYDLTHERMIPALRRIANMQLSVVDHANQLLDQRTNEWIGNNRNKRYLLSWSELRLLKRYKRLITWGKNRQQKEELVSGSYHKVKIRYAGIGITIALVISGWFAWNTNKWQTYLIKRELQYYANNSIDPVALTEIAKTFDDSQSIIKTIRRISAEETKFAALTAIAKHSTLLNDIERTKQMMTRASESANKISDSRTKSEALMAIAEHYAELNDIEKTKQMMTRASESADKISDPRTKSDALRVIAKQYAKLAVTLKDKQMITLSYDFTISDPYLKSYALSAVIEQYAKLAVTLKDKQMIALSYDFTKNISDSHQKSSALITVVEQYAKLAAILKDKQMMTRASESANKIDDPAKSYALRAIAEQYAKLGDIEMAKQMMTRAYESANKISDKERKSYALKAIAEQYAKFNDIEKAKQMINLAYESANKIDDPAKSYALMTTAEQYAKFNDIEKAKQMMNLVSESANKISDLYRDSYDPKAIAEQYARLAIILKDKQMMTLASESANKISDPYTKHLTLRVIAEQYAKLAVILKDKQMMTRAYDVAKNISDPDEKSEALSTITEQYAKLAVILKDNSLYYQSFSFIEQFGDDDFRNKILTAILSSKLALKDISQLRELTRHYQSDAGKAIALARIMLAIKYPELIDKKNAEKETYFGRYAPLVIVGH